MDAVIEDRLGKLVIFVFKISDSKVHYWTSSNIVLHWIKNSSSNWKPFVSNIVTERQSLVNFMNWRHCSACSNPVDGLTR